MCPSHVCLVIERAKSGRLKNDYVACVNLCDSMFDIVIADNIHKSLITWHTLRFYTLCSLHLIRICFAKSSEMKSIFKLTSNNNISIDVFPSWDYIAEAR